ncbi:ACT domain-containing protein [Halovivax gelatinilyticus]|uniref:ACT domain-containing protein n=1 Tax=Halovivax gelatinilyticus TaxID=2961597 RepID=UPI0020CA4B04|nr:ACT domain-containing protein [Halovivax gelatinilyticus]
MDGVDEPSPVVSEMSDDLEPTPDRLATRGSTDDEADRTTTDRSHHTADPLSHPALETDTGPAPNAVRADGGTRTAVTIRIELDDEPGALVDALSPIADHGGNLRSIHHERGNRTPRGAIPVEIDFACPLDRIDRIVEALRQADVTVTQAGTHAYERKETVVLVGDRLAASLSSVLADVDGLSYASVVESSLVSPTSTDGPASASLTIAVADGRLADAFDVVGTVAADHGLDVIEPLSGVRT